MSQETINGALSLLFVALINAATYFLTRRAGKQDTKAVKEDMGDMKEDAKTYVDKYIGQLLLRVEGCDTAIAAVQDANTKAIERAELAVKEAAAAREQIALLTPRITDLENQIVDLQAQLASKKQEVTRVEGERDSAVTELNTLEQMPARKSVEEFMQELLALLEKRFPLPAITDSPTIVDAGTAATDDGESEEAAA